MTEENKNSQEEKKTTGHKWDGIGEYDIPAPRWWLIVWIICTIWAIIYWFFYPAWPIPGGNSKGSLGWTKHSQLQESQAEIDAVRQSYLEKISKMSLSQIQKDDGLMEFALNGGRAAFKENCAACHGTGAQGFKGFPNLNDDDWLWGGKVTDIYQTIKYGIRSSHDKTRSNQMPSFGLDQILSKEQISAVADHVLSLSGKAEKNSSGAKIFAENCASCHGVNAKGNQELGAPNLTDSIWLYGKDKADIEFTINYSRNGVMPYWKDRLDDETIKQLALYIHSLGGGE